MSSRPERVKTRIKQGAEPSVHKQVYLVNSSEPSSFAEDGETGKVDALVCEYLKELDDLSADLKLKSKDLEPTSEPKNQIATAGRTVTIPTKGENRLLQQIPSDQQSGSDEAGRSIPDVDAELARTLDEIEKQEKSNVVALSHSDASINRQEDLPPLAEVEPLPVTGDVSEEVSNAGLQDDLPEKAIEPTLDLRSTITETKSSRMNLRIIITFAAVVLLGIIALGIYHFSPSEAGNPSGGEERSDTPILQAALTEEMPRLGDLPPDVGSAGPSLQDADSPESLGNSDESTSVDPSGDGSDAVESAQSEDVSNSEPGTDESRGISATPPRKTESKTPTAISRTGIEASESMRRPTARPGELEEASSPMTQNEPAPGLTVPAKPAVAPASENPQGRAEENRVSSRPNQALTASDSTSQPASIPEEEESLPGNLIADASASSSAMQTVLVPSPQVQDFGTSENVTPSLGRNSASTPASTPEAAEPPATEGNRPHTTGIPSDTKADAAPTSQPSNSPGPISPAIPISKVNPTYPALARSAKKGGTVKLIARVDQEGIVRTVSVVSGPEILHKAAIEALMKWRFKPAIQDGVNVSSVVVVAFNFTN